MPADAMTPHVSLNRGPRIKAVGLLAVAFHESGHAIIASLFRVQVLRASILADVPTIGHVLFEPESYAQASRHVRVYIACAGSIAQNHAATIGACGLAPDYGVFDRMAMRTTLALWHGVDPSDAVVDAEMETHRASTTAAVRTQWRWITRVAHLLADRKVLTGEEIEGLK